MLEFIFGVVFVLIAVVFVILPLMLIASAVITNSAFNSGISKTYDLLDSMEFKVLDPSGMLASVPITIDDNRCNVILHPEGTVKAGTNSVSYLHNSEATALDPISRKWLKKYHKWFKENTQYLDESNFNTSHGLFPLKEENEWFAAYKLSVRILLEERILRTIQKS